MSQEVSVRENCMTGRRPGFAYHQQRALDAVRLCWHCQGNLVQRVCEPLDRSERQYMGVDTAAWRRHRSRARLRQLFGSGLGATAGDLHRRQLGISELQVHSVRALLGFDDHLHRPAGNPLRRLSDFAVKESRRPYVRVGRHLRANRGLSKRSPTTGRIFDEIERRY
jgi:hypothetical protein